MCDEVGLVNLSIVDSRGMSYGGISCGFDNFRDLVDLAGGSWCHTWCWYRCDTWSLSMKHCVHWSSEQARIMVLHMVLLQGTAQGRSVTHGAFQ